MKKLVLSLLLVFVIASIGNCMTSQIYVNDSCCAYYQLAPQVCNVKTTITQTVSVSKAAPRVVYQYPAYPMRPNFPTYYNYPMTPYGPRNCEPRNCGPDYSYYNQGFRCPLVDCLLVVPAQVLNSLCSPDYDYNYRYPSYGRPYYGF